MTFDFVRIDLTKALKFVMQSFLLIGYAHYYKPEIIRMIFTTLYLSDRSGRFHRASWKRIWSMTHFMSI